MSRKLALTVHVTDAGGDSHVFRAGVVPPQWAQEAITNPHAWAADIATEDDEQDEQGGGPEVTGTDPGKTDPASTDPDPDAEPLARTGKANGRGDKP